MRDVVFDLKVFHLEVFNVLHFLLELNLWEGVRLTLELNLQGLDVVVVHVRVAQGVDKLAGLQTWNEIGFKQVSRLWCITLSLKLKYY